MFLLHTIAVLSVEYHKQATHLLQIDGDHLRDNKSREYFHNNREYLVVLILAYNEYNKVKFIFHTIGLAVTKFKFFHDELCSNGNNKQLTSNLLEFLSYYCLQKLRIGAWLSDELCFTEFL